MTDLSRDDLLHLVSTRHEMIEAICQGTLDKRHLQRSLDVSRPTVDRAFRELEENGLLDSQGTDYVVTRFGRLFCDQFQGHIANLDEMVRLGPYLATLPESAPVDERVLMDAEILNSEPHAPLSPVSEMGRLAADADTVVAYMNVILPYVLSILDRNVNQGEMDGTIILPTDVMEQALGEYMSEISTLLENEGFSLIKSEARAPHGIALVDDELVGVSIRDEDSHLQGILINDTPAAVEWAREQLDRLAAEGEQYEFTRGSRSIRAR